MSLPFVNKPVRQFSANVGETSVGTRGPDAIEQDIDNLCKMFDPSATLSNGSQGGIRGGNIADSSITTSNIADGNIEERHLGLGSVTNSKLGVASVSTDKIQDLAVNENKLSASAVTTAKIADLAITDAKLGPSSVTTEKIADLAVTTAKIANLAVTTAKLADSAVTNLKLADASVNTFKLADSSVISNKLADSSVLTAKLADGAVTDAKLATDSVTQAKIASASVGSGELIDNAVSTSKILDNSVTTSKIANNSVNSSKLGFSAVEEINLNDLAVTNAKLASSAVTSIKIADSSVTTSKIADTSVTTEKLASSSVTDAKLATGISGAKLTDKSVTTAKIQDINTVATKPTGFTTTTNLNTALLYIIDQINQIKGSSIWYENVQGKNLSEVSASLNELVTLDYLQQNYNNILTALNQDNVINNAGWISDTFANMQGAISSLGTPKSIKEEYSITTTAGQTVIPIADYNYLADDILVFINTTFLPASEYTKTNNQITLKEAAVAGDVVNVRKEKYSLIGGSTISGSTIMINSIPLDRIVSIQVVTDSGTTTMTLTDFFDYLQAKIGSNKTQINTIIADVDAVEGNIASIQGTIGTINSKLATNDTNISTINSSILTINGNIAGIDLELNGIDGSITSLQSAVNTLETSLATKEANLQGQINTVTSNLNTEKSRIDGLVTRVTTAETAINTANTNIASLQTSVNTLNTHASNKSNPHAVTKAQIGLGNVTDVAQCPLTTFNAHDASLTAHGLGGASLSIGLDAQGVNGGIAIGRAAKAIANINGMPGHLAVGDGAISDSSYCIAIGNIAKAGDSKSTVPGGTSGSIAIGRNAIANTYMNQIAIGINSVATGKDQGVLGSPTSAYSGTKVWYIPGNFSVGGTKSFEIQHPHPDKKETHMLRHSAVESPTAGDNLYRFKVEAVSEMELISISLPDYFKYLNKDVDVYVSPDRHFGRAYGYVDEDYLCIKCEEPGKYNVLVIGTRQDDNVQEFDIRGIERLIGESWNGESEMIVVDEIRQVEEIKGV